MGKLEFIDGCLDRFTVVVVFLWGFLIQFVTQGTWGATLALRDDFSFWNARYFEYCSCCVCVELLMYMLYFRMLCLAWTNVNVSMRSNVKCHAHNHPYIESHLTAERERHTQRVSETKIQKTYKAHTH